MKITKESIKMGVRKIKEKYKLAISINYTIRIAKELIT